MSAVTNVIHDDRQGRPRPGHIYAELMRRVNGELWGGVVMLVVVVGVAAPVLLGFVPTRIPHGLWIAVFGMMLVAVVASVTVGSRNLARVLFASALVAAWAALVTAQGAGLFNIVIVVFAAVSVYIVPWQATAFIIIVNTIMIGFSNWLQGAELASVLASMGLYAFLQVGTALSSATLLREQRMRRDLAASHVELQATNVLLADSSRAAERLRISRDLHDSIGHHLTVLSLELEAARHSDDLAARAHVERASDVARQVLGDLRTTVGDLRDESSRLSETMRGVVTDVPGLDIELDIDDDLELGDAAQTALVRALQEVVTNSLRHGEAALLQISIRADGGATVFESRDNGRGSGRIQPGNGLRGLIERFDALGGTVELDGSDGFSVTGRIPA